MQCEKRVLCAGSDRFKTGSRQVQDRFKTGSRQVQDRFKTGSRQVQDRFKTGRLVQAGSDRREGFKLVGVDLTERDLVIDMVEMLLMLLYSLLSVSVSVLMFLLEVSKIFYCVFQNCG